jgi:four helix bundle protein
MRGFRNVPAWHQAMTLVELVYGVSKRLPLDEQTSGIGLEMRRTAVKIPGKVASGFVLGGRRYRCRVLASHSLLMQLDVLLELVVRLQLLPRDDIMDAWNMLQEVEELLTALADSLEPPQ